MINPLQPLEAPYSPEIDALLSKYPQIDGYLLSLFRTFANSPRFLEKGVANLLDPESPLALRDREIVILRVTARNNCEYEWGIHVSVFSKAAELTDPQIAATCVKKIRESLWTRQEVTLLQTVDALCDGGQIPDELQARFQADWTAEQQLEIMALCGTYHTVSFVANTARLSIEPFAAQFPS